MSPAVSRATSSIVVVPFSTLRQPSCRSVIMPALSASWRITPELTRCDDQVADHVVGDHQLVDAGPAAIAALAARPAAGPLPEFQQPLALPAIISTMPCWIAMSGRLEAFFEREIHRQFVVIGYEGRLALRADRPHQPLGHDAFHRAGRPGTARRPCRSGG